MSERTIPGTVRAAPGAGARPAPKAKPAWVLPTGLITLGLIPIFANALRRVALAIGAADSSPAQAAAPLTLPVLIHIFGATVFVILGAFQFSAGFRGHRPSWHRNAGRVLVIAGLLAALSGLWLAMFGFFTTASGPLLLLFRLLAGAGMVLCIVLGFTAIRRRDIQRHRAWMVRAFALGLGAGTQVFTLGFGEVILGKSELSGALLNAAGWVINLAVAEAAIRRPSWRGGRLAATRVPTLP